jgi:hypothetical protein
MRIRRFRVEDVRRIAREADFEFRLPGMERKRA